MSLKKKTFNSKHLAKGDPLPPYTGTLRVYNMRYCPFAQRTVLVLNAKNIDYEVVNVNLASKPEWFASKSPFTTVPAIEISDGVTVYESLIAAEYLDDVYPHRRLQSDVPLLRARDKLIIEHCSLMNGFLFRCFKSPDMVDDELQRALKSLDFIQAELDSRGGQFLGGSQPGYGDYMIWPWFERLPAVAKMLGKEWPFVADKYARLTQWVADMRQDSAVSQYLVEDDIHAKYFTEAYVVGERRYDFLDEK